MTDATRRELERALAASPDDAGLRAKLRSAEEHDGVRRVFPPRRKVRAWERPRERWCPVCATWSLRTREQKFRTKRAESRRYCLGHIRRFDGPDAIDGVMRDCPGPAKGQHARAPLAALEVELLRVKARRAQNVHYGQSFDNEISWFEHRIAVERRRLGIAPPATAVVEAHQCRQSRVDYVEGDRAKVACKDCGAVWRLDRAGEMIEKEGPPPGPFSIVGADSIELRWSAEDVARVPGFRARAAEDVAPLFEDDDKEET